MKYCLPALILLSLCMVSVAQQLDLPRRWVYCSANLLLDKDVDALEPLFARAAKAGYNGVMLSDEKFGQLDMMPPRYFQNVDRVKKIAAANKLEIIPELFPIGYSSSLLVHNPNLAEGLPVRDALFEAKGGILQQISEPEVGFKGSDLKNFSGWDEHDKIVTLSDGVATVTDPQGRPSRFMQKVKVHPYRQYHISVMVKTVNFEVKPKIIVHAPQKHELNYADLSVKKTQDWTLCHIVFNSMGYDEVSIYFGCWEGTTGTLSWKEPKIEETAFVNLLRRDGAPLVASIENGRALEEGKDFDKIIDPKLGKAGWSAEAPWRAAFDVWHTPPVARASLPDGTRVRMSFYHAVSLYEGQVMICPSEPETIALLRDEAQRLHKTWGAKGYFMAHDEIRILNRDKSCTDRQMTPGGILADNVKTCIGILRGVNPGGDIYVWSDMFDPKHNAHGDYFFVNGDFADSWRGLDKDVIIVLWGYQERDPAMKWFESLGNRMLIAGYYDAHPEKIKDWLTSAKQVKGVIGVIYTTWQDRYGDLEEFSRMIDEAR